MEYVRFGNTGMKVSRICCGCMSFGSSDWAKWVLNEKESFEMIKKAWESGVNFFDTADVYSNGDSERVLGKAIKELKIPRSQIILATKAFFHVREPGSLESFQNPTPKDPATTNQCGLSRKHLFESIEQSLKRLGVDYIDLYQIHRFDNDTPIEETMEALHDLVKLGKVRYIGASSMWAWQFAKMNAVAEKNGWTKFVSMQNFYNLLYREEEREMIPLLQDQGIAMIPWSPLARGALSGKSTSVRSQEDIYRTMMFSKEQEVDNTIVGRVVEIAERLSKDKDQKISPSQVALAWLYSKQYISAPIIGLGKELYLQEALLAMKLKLSEDDIKYLESPYTPKRVMGHM